MTNRDAEVCLRKNMIEWGRRWAERDAEGILAHYAPEAVLFVPGEPVAQGTPVYSQFIHEILRNPDFALAWAIDHATVSSDGGTGYVYGRYVQHNPHSGRSGYEVETGHFVTVFRRDGSKWLAVAEINTPGPIAGRDGLPVEIFNSSDPSSPTASDDEASSTVRTGNLAVIRRHILEFWQEGRTELGPQLYASDFIDHNPAPGGGTGLAAITEVVAMMQAGFSNQKYEIIHLFTVGDLVVDHWVFRAKHTGDFAGIKATNQDIEFSGSDIFRMKDGKIVEIWHTEEIARLLEQLRS